MLNQNNYYCEHSEYKEQKERSANDSSPQTQPKKTPSARRIGTFTMGITLVLVGILLLVFLFPSIRPDAAAPLFSAASGAVRCGNPLSIFSQPRAKPALRLLGNLVCCFIIFCSLIACAAYPFVEYGTTYWQVSKESAVRFMSKSTPSFLTAFRWNRWMSAVN